MKTFKEFIVEQLATTSIFEMAVELKDYRDKTISLFIPLICHIMLIIKAREEKSSEYVDHWKHEIRGFFNQLYKMKLKIKDNDKKRYDLVKKTLCRDFEYDTIDNYGELCSGKLYEEGYDLDDDNVKDEFKEITRYIQDNLLEDIIICMSTKDHSNIDNFINKL